MHTPLGRLSPQHRGTVWVTHTPLRMPSSGPVLTVPTFHRPRVPSAVIYTVILEANFFSNCYKKTCHLDNICRSLGRAWTRLTKLLTWVGSSDREGCGRASWLPSSSVPHQPQLFPPPSSPEPLSSRFRPEARLEASAVFRGGRDHQGEHRATVPKEEVQPM